jgi:ligand-binding SRPBCC domain-containing protein
VRINAWYRLTVASKSPRVESSDSGVSDGEDSPEVRFVRGELHEATGIEGPMRFIKESRIAAPPEAVFAFHESPGALERLTPPWEKVEVVEGGTSIRPGSRVVLRTRLGPFSLRWIAEHTEYDPPRSFADRQVSGPFASWSHRHQFEDDGAGGTLLRDEVEYEPPLGWLGRRLGGRYLEGKLRSLFDYRHEQTRKIVESGDFPGYAGAGDSTSQVETGGATGPEP